MPTADKWSDPGAGRRYASRRFKTARAAGRDPRLVARILDRHGVRPGHGGLLDAPCGTGRLWPELSGRGEPVTCVDLSAEMLAELPPDAYGARRIRASADDLPFPDGAFDVVVCCRLLHHLRDAPSLERVTRELVRVSSRLVIASFWDAASLPAWRVRAGLKRDEGPRGRTSLPRATIAAHIESAGARVLGFEHSLRFVSQQTFLVASVEPA